MNARRIRHYAAKLRNSLHEQWAREQLESKRKEAQQADLMKWALNARTPKITQPRTKSA